MSVDGIYHSGKVQLAAIPDKSDAIKFWKDTLLELGQKWNFEDDPYVWLSCVQALMGVGEGNFGVGALLLDEEDNILIQDHNKSFVPAYRSDLHAEMVVLNTLETQFPQKERIKDLDYRLFSSLEPCPMCLTRLLYSDIKGIYYASEDNLGGMTRRIDAMPPFFQGIASRHNISQASCSPTLQKAGWEIMGISMEELNRKIT